MATITSTLALNDKMSSTFRSITTAMSSTLTAMRTIKGVDIGEEFAQAAADINRAERAIDSLEDEMNNFSRTPSRVGDGFTVMKGIAVSALTAIASAAKNAVGDVVRLADQTTTQAARLSMVNDGLQTQVELQDAIFAAAQRTRTPYSDMVDTVSKLNLLAGDAFSTNKEATAYAELLSKSFKVAGTDTMAQVGATRQLVQALGSGVLRGDELNSVFEAAPNIIRNIADYLEVPIGQIRDMAGDGELTADIIKAAMFAAADDINSKFAQMPMTIGEIGTATGNALYLAFTPALQAIGEGARYIYDNWSEIGPVFYGVAAAVGGAATAWGIYTIAQGLATLSVQGFNAALKANAIYLIIGAIISFIAWVAVMYNTNLEFKFGFLRIWNDIINFFEQVPIFFTGVGHAISNVFDFMAIQVLLTFERLANGIIGRINEVISGINTLTGTEFGLIENVTFATEAAELSAADKASRADALAQMKLEQKQAASYRDRRLSYEQERAGEKAAEAGEVFDLSEYSATAAGGGKALKTAEQNKLITDEDIKLLADVATRDYQLNYRQITPNVQFGDMYINNEMDADGVIERFASAMEEMAASSLEVA